jgi:hypothetical protein
MGHSRLILPISLPAHLCRAVEGLIQVGTVTEEPATANGDTKPIERSVSRQGLETTALALKLIFISARY